MIQLRAAEEKEAGFLSELAYCSEAHWENDEGYMERFRFFYNITEEFIRNNPVFIFEEDRCPVGFWGLAKPEDDWELEFFYIAEPYIGKGYGRLLWYSLIEECRKREIDHIEFTTSPEARLFYEKMGAKTVCDVESLLKKGRMIPKLKYFI